MLSFHDNALKIPDFAAYYEENDFHVILYRTSIYVHNHEFLYLYFHIYVSFLLISIFFFSNSFHLLCMLLIDSTHLQKV